MNLRPYAALAAALLQFGAAMAAGMFIPTGSMTTVRLAHTATLLLDGRVLIAGGDGFGATPVGRTAELYDPTTRRFVRTGDMARPRGFHSATRLTNGKVLIVGGWFNQDAELYDPSTGTFSPAGNLLTAQGWHRAALLPNGKVLITGNNDAELYDPQTGRFEAAGAYARPMSYIHTATSLADGRVLLVGADPAQVYDPATNGFSLTGWLGDATNRYGVELHSATLLENGKVLVAGGMSDDGEARTARAALYDPATGRFTLTSDMRAVRDAHMAVRLRDGRVLILGGDTMICANACFYGGVLASTERYDPSSGTFATEGDMSTPRTGSGATLLANGDVLVTGGGAAAELYRPLSSAPNYQGLWWNSPAGSEPGWGVSIAHQGNILFATWFTYDLDGRAMWLVMPRGEAKSQSVYAGPLYRTLGPAFSSPVWDATQVMVTMAGSATFEFREDDALFTATLDGITRTKTITRQVFATDP